MTSPVFLSYRRADSQQATGRLFSRMAPRYLAPAEVFMDVEAIAAGRDFVAALREQLKDCRVCLVMIGPSWLSLTGSDGRSRLDDPTDYVRLEIAECLARDVTVIPVLVDNARMPSAGELPEPLKPLASLNAVHLVHDRFDADADALAAKVLKALGRSADTELDLLKLLFSFRGTISRRPFWIGFVLLLIAQAVVTELTNLALGAPFGAPSSALSSGQKLIHQAATLWFWWPNLALVWKRIRDLGHGWDFFLPVLGVVLGHIGLNLAGYTTEAQTALVVALVLFVVLGTLKGTRFVAHNA